MPQKPAPVPPPLPIIGEALFTRPETFWKRVIYCTETERRALRGLIASAALIGLIAGFWWGGMFDPWHGEKRAVAALINLLLFGGWGLAETTGLLMARNFELVKRPGGLLPAAGLFGGLWVALWSALEMALTSFEVFPKPLSIAIGGLSGFIIGGSLSIFSALRLSKLMFIPGEILASPAAQATARIPPATPPTSTSRRSMIVWIVTGSLIAMVFGGVLMGGLAYKTLDALREVQEKFEVDRLTLEPVTPIPYAAIPADENLLLNGDFQNLDGWKRYDLTAADDVIDLKTGPGYVVWTRTNSRGESGALGVYQDNLHIDLSGADRIMLDFDVWVGGHTRIGEGEWTESDGIAGEMPAHVEITYLDKDGEVFLWDRGFLVYGLALPQHAETVEKGVWTHISLNLRDDAVRVNPKGDLLPPPTTITKVMVYGNGWDFAGAIGNLAIRNKNL